MPIYEYRCPDCGHQFEAMQKFSDDPITVCPSCEADRVKKLISAPAFHLKGGGWYKDHYGLKSGADGAAKSPESPSSAAPPSGGASPGASSDSSSSGGSSTAAAAPTSSAADSKSAS